MVLNIVDNGSTCFGSSNVWSLKLFATKDRVNTPANGAREWIVEYHVDDSQLVLWVNLVPLGNLALQDTCKILDGNARVGV